MTLIILHVSLSCHNARCSSTKVSYYDTGLCCRGDTLIFFIVAHVSGCISVSYKYMQQQCAVRQVGSAWILVMQLNSELMDELDLSKCFQQQWTSQCHALIKIQARRCGTEHS